MPVEPGKERPEILRFRKQRPGQTLPGVSPPRQPDGRIPGFPARRRLRHKAVPGKRWNFYV
ncbi:MAG: hypothetical protein CW346_01475 [Bacillaceae bacterium]|nr:hypothetical protein [Bacillaceae bacterium]